MLIPVPRRWLPYYPSHLAHTRSSSYPTYCSSYHLYHVPVQFQFVRLLRYAVPQFPIFTSLPDTVPYVICYPVLPSHTPHHLPFLPFVLTRVGSLICWFILRYDSTHTHLYGLRYYPFLIYITLLVPGFCSWLLRYFDLRYYHLCVRVPIPRFARYVTVRSAHFAHCPARTFTFPSICSSDIPVPLYVPGLLTLRSLRYSPLPRPVTTFITFLYYVRYVPRLRSPLFCHCCCSIYNAAFTLPLVIYAARWQRYLTLLPVCCCWLVPQLPFYVCYLPVPFGYVALPVPRFVLLRFPPLLPFATLYLPQFYSHYGFIYSVRSLLRSLCTARSLLRCCTFGWRLPLPDRCYVTTTRALAHFMPRRLITYGWLLLLRLYAFHVYVHYHALPVYAFAVVVAPVPLYYPVVVAPLLVTPPPPCYTAFVVTFVHYLVLPSSHVPFFMPHTTLLLPFLPFIVVLPVDYVP